MYQGQDCGCSGLQTGVGAFCTFVIIPLEDSYRLTKVGLRVLLDNGVAEVDISNRLDAPFDKLYVLRLSKAHLGKCYIVAEESPPAATSNESGGFGGSWGCFGGFGKSLKKTGSPSSSFRSSCKTTRSFC